VWIFGRGSGFLAVALASGFEQTFFARPSFGTFRFETLRIVGIGVCGILCLCGAFKDVKRFNTEGTEGERREIGDGNGINAETQRAPRKAKSTGKIAYAVMCRRRRENRRREKFCRLGKPGRSKQRPYLGSRGKFAEGHMDIFEEVVRMRRAGERGALATIVHTNGSIPSYESSRMLVRDDGSSVGTVGGGCVEAEVWAAAKEVIVTEQPRKMVFNLNHDAQYDAGLICGGTLEIFVEPVLPQPTLYIFGGGHVSTAVAPLAHQAGFKIAIVDDRESFANAERFPMATEIFTSYEEAFEKIQPTSSSYLLIVTRGHSGDMRVLAWAVGSEARGFTPRYIGMMGSKRKVIAVYKALEKEGFSAAQFERVHAPVGLDIGALTPEEIAVSITAELIAVRRNAAALPNKSIKLSEAAQLLGD
jgi:xanthine dehydrogenase accessory factor